MFGGNRHGNNPDKGNRILFLDGLRGIAIVSVLLYHSYVRWGNLTPYGSEFASGLASYGWLGVELFFLISGFVIFLTLEKSANFPDFITRRWIRLFPAMLVCSILIFSTTLLFPERPAGQPMFHDFLPGLSFIEPNKWSRLLGTEVHPLEGTFWTLFVEVKFYFVAGILFFTIGGKKTIGVIVATFLLATYRELFPELLPASLLSPLHSFVSVTAAQYFGWFAAGALFYRFFQTRKFSIFVLALIVAVLAALALTEPKPRDIFSPIAIALFFAVVIYQPLTHKLLSNRALLFMGIISYPLYLLHENMVVAMIVKFGHVAPRLPHILLPVLPIAAMIAIAALVTRFAEPWTKVQLLPIYTRARLLMRIPVAPPPVV
ncbi:MAG: hypothetical protein JWP38_3668 [Herbaspirillum sp.]|jgi:peptidoglycan/LPS O-acetylase OafA/YrhL|nr:hypothetical protein [Herbaspirillum sp.]